MKLHVACLFPNEFSEIHGIGSHFNEACGIKFTQLAKSAEIIAN